MNAYYNLTSNWQIIGGYNDHHTMLLIHSNTTDGSTTFTDSSASGHSLGDNGDVHHSTDEKKFGTSSIFFDPAEESYIDSANSSDWNFGTDPFTIDFWFRSNSGSSGYNMITDHRNSVSNYVGWVVGIDTDGYIGGGVQNNALSPTDRFTWSTTNVRDNSWHHFALVREANGTIKMYLDGVHEGTPNTLGGIDVDNSVDLVIGCDDTVANFYDGYLDELRISKGVARWTSNFVVPKKAYS